MTTDQELIRLKIKDAVKPPEGNGLSSRVFQPPFNFMFIFSWVDVEQGVEAIVCDGQTVQKTQLKSDMQRLIGRKRYYHRVLLKPAPLVVNSTAFSKDSLKVKIETSVKFEVIDPGYVCSVQSPVDELSAVTSQAVADCISNYISSQLISENSGIRDYILTQMRKSNIVIDHYDVIEVLQVVPSIDERFMEIEKKTKEASLKAPLIQAEKANELRAARVDLQIESEKDVLSQKILDKEQERRMELEILKQRSETIRAGLEAIKGMAMGGIDPTIFTRDVLSAINLPGQLSSDQSQLTTQDKHYLPSSLDKNEVDKAQLLEKEKSAIIAIKPSLKIVNHEVSFGPTGIIALVQFESYEIIFSCGSNYPEETPDATIRYYDGNEKTPQNYWFPGVSNLLAQALTYIIPQV